MLGTALARKFHEDNYTNEYLARRCRTAVEIVASWRTGAIIPNYRDWWYLLRVHRSFDRLASLWKRAAADAGLPTEDPDFVGDRRQREVPMRRPAEDTLVEGRPIERITQVTRVIEVRAPEEVDLPGLGPQDFGERDVPAPPPPIAPPAPPPSPPSPTSSTSSGEPAIRVPDGFIVYRCRITRGRILELPLPADLSSSDVDRLCAFLRTQIDDDKEGSR